MSSKPREALDALVRITKFSGQRYKIGVMRGTQREEEKRREEKRREEKRRRDEKKKEGNR